MIARKITYKGQFNQEDVGAIYDITRKNEITGQVRSVSSDVVELNLEGDPAQIKLIQHMIERKVKAAISGKLVERIPFQHYRGIVLLS